MHFNDVTKSFSDKMNGLLCTIHQSLNRVDSLFDCLIIVARVVLKSCECKFYHEPNAYGVSQPNLIIKFHPFFFCCFAAKQNRITFDMGWTGNELHVVYTMIWSVTFCWVEGVLCCKVGIWVGRLLQELWQWWSNRRQAQGLMLLSKREKQFCILAKFI
jgi:hypothetical protein